MSTILILGATGTVGQALVKALGRTEAPFKCAVRDAEKAHRILPRDVEQVVADLADPPSIEAAAAGCERLFLLSANDSRMAERQIAGIDAAKRAGVRHVTALSCLIADTSLPIAAQHREIEEHLKATGLDWTILRPNFLMQNLLSTAGNVRAESRIPLPFDRDAPITMIDAVDVAAIAVKTLTEAGHAGQIYELAGPPVTLGDFATALFGSIERSIAYVHVSPDDLRQSMERKGAPEWAIEHQLAIARMVNAGELDIEDRDFRRLAGDPPRTLSTFLSYNVISFDD